MKKLPFAWLGSKRAKKQGAGDKAGLLDMGHRLGLPVYTGVVLLHRVYDLLLEAGVIVAENDPFDQFSASRIHCPDPDWLLQTLRDGVRLPPLAEPMIVRAAFTDGEGQPFDPVPPVRDVDFSQPQAVAAALCTLWTAVADQPDTFRRDLIIQEQIPIQHEGIAFSDSAYQDDQYSVVSDQLSMNGDLLPLPQLRSGERADESQPGFVRRLQMLLRGVRRTFGRGVWRVEWADDGEICWLLQVNLVPTPPVRSEQFVPLRLGRIRPLPPLNQLIAAETADLYHHLFGRLDRHLPSSRPPLFKIEGEQLWCNQSLLLDTMRHWGLSTQPVCDLLGSEARPFGRQQGRLRRRVPLLLRLGLRQLWTAAQAENQTAYWLDQIKTAASDETAVSTDSVPTVIEAQANLWQAAITAQFSLLGPISPNNTRIAQAQAIWQEALAQTQAITAN
jgi:rifampicin phosphotransferase